MSKVWDGKQWVDSLWRTIDSAPKDGSRVLCFQPGRQVYFASFIQKYEFTTEKQWVRRGSTSSSKCTPTHWLALPATPTVPTDGLKSEEIIDVPWGAGVEAPKIEYNPNTQSLSNAMIQAETVEHKYQELNRTALRATILRQVLDGQAQDKRQWLSYATTKGNRFELGRERYNNIPDVWYVKADGFWMWSSTNRDVVINVAKAFDWEIFIKEEEDK